MSGLDLRQIREALAAQIVVNTARSISGHPYDPGDHTQPSFYIEAADPYVSPFSTFGPSGVADVHLEIVIEVAATRMADAQIAMDDYLSAGTGNTSSIFDAVHADRTLGGAVDDSVCLSAGKPEFREDGVLVARVPVEIMVTKQNAEVG